MNNQTENKRHLFRGFCPDKPYQTKVGKDTIMINGQVIHGEWVKGYLKNANTIDTYREMEIDGQIYEVFDYSSIVIPETVGQWVMVDKDDNDIFGGDIIGIHQFLFDGSEHENELIGRVVWDDERVCWTVDHIDHRQIQRYMGYDEDVNFEKVKIPLCELYGLHEESYQRIDNSWEIKQ